MEINKLLETVRAFLENDNEIENVYDFNQIGLGPMKGLTILMRDGELFNLICTKSKFAKMARENSIEEVPNALGTAKDRLESDRSAFFGGSGSDSRNDCVDDTVGALPIQTR